MIPATNKYGVVQKQIDPHTTDIQTDGHIPGTRLWVDPALHARTLEYAPRDPAPVKPEPLLAGTIDHRKVAPPPAPTAEAMERSGPDPWATPEKPPTPAQGTVIEPENPAPQHQWPTITGKPGTVVKLSGNVVGYVDASGVVKITEPSPADEMIRESLLTKIDSKGELK